MFQSGLFENISETKYLSADNYTVYRTIMRIFYLEHQKMHCQMDRDTVLSLFQRQPQFIQYTPERLTLDLQQLVNWKNLTPIQDPRKPRTIAESKNRQFQYMMSQSAIEIERMTITLENLSTRTAGDRPSTASFTHLKNTEIGRQAGGKGKNLQANAPAVSWRS